jgi:Tfp pilus assembly protein PilF
MTLVALFLAAALAPQEPAAVPPPEESAPSSEAAPAMAPDAPPAVEAAADAGAAEGYIEAGLKAFRRHRFSAAQADFQKAVDADPQSAAATFYLGYTYYKIAEPTRRLTAGKKKAAELFAKAFELNPAFRPAWGEKG